MKKYFFPAGVAAIILSMAAFFIMLAIPGQVKQEVTRVSYEQKGNFSYQVNVKPSYLYGPEPQAAPPDAQYPLAAVESLDFTYSFINEESAPVYGRVEALLQNPGIWQKSISLLPEVSGDDKLTLAFRLYPAQMETLFAEIEKETGISEGSRALTLNVYIRQGEVSLTHSLPIGLDSGLILVSGTLNKVFTEGQGWFEYRVNRKVLAVGDETRAPAKYPAELLKSLDFTFSYEMNSTDPANLAIPEEVTIEAVLENPEIWKKSLKLAAASDWQFKQPLTFNLDWADLQKQFEAIDQETNTMSELHLITLQARLIKGDETIVQSLPMAIENNVLTISSELELKQAFGSGVFDYRVNLKPNTLYDTLTLYPPVNIPGGGAASPEYELYPQPASGQFGEVGKPLAPGQTIFTQLIDKMDVIFDYSLKTSQPVNNVKTTIDVMAVIESPKAWTKSVPLTHASGGSSASLAFGVDMPAFIELIQSINKETGVPATGYTIAITAYVHSTAESAYGRIDETFSPALAGTINNNILVWNSNAASAKSGAIKSLESIANPQRYLGMGAGAARGLLLAATLILLLAGVAGLVFGFKIKTAVLSPVEKKAQAIKKKYGVRLVETLDYPLPDDQHIIPLKTMEDLIKVADELAKPVIYRVAAGTPTGVPGARAAGGPDIRTYSVQDGLTMYQFVLAGGEQKADDQTPDKQ